MVGVVWLGNCDGTSPEVVLPSISLAWKRFSRPVDQEGRVILEWLAYDVPVLACASLFTVLTMMLVPTTMGRPRLIWNSLLCDCRVQRRSALTAYS